MTNLKKVLFLLIVSLVFFACQDKSKPENNNQEDPWANFNKYEVMKIEMGTPYEYEKTILRDLIATFNQLGKAVEKAQSADDITSALKNLYKSLEELNPAIAKITQDNPGWGTSPPRELKEIINDYLKANQNFNERTMNLIGQYMIDNPDNQELHSIFEKLKELL